MISALEAKQPPYASTLVYITNYHHLIFVKFSFLKNVLLYKILNSKFRP